MAKSITEVLGIKYPIIQGGMAWISDAKLAAAVSNAGGAGIISCGGRTTEYVREEIRKAKQLTDKPFGVNVMLMAPNKDEIVDVICEEKPAFVTLGAGNPVPYFAKLKEAGIKVIPVIPNVKLAKRVAAAGADAMVAEGMEAGGHIGVLTTMALMTQVIPEIKDIPVVMAGGFGDGRGLAAAMLMGAGGVQMGTRFLVAEECSVHENMKQKLIEAVKAGDENQASELLWQLVIDCQNCPFKTVSGLPFSYTIKRGRNGELTKELWIDRRENSKSLAWSSIRLAFSNAMKIKSADRPKALGDIRGVSYIYPMLWRFGVLEVPQTAKQHMNTEL